MRSRDETLLSGECSGEGAGFVTTQAGGTDTQKHEHPEQLGGAGKLSGKPKGWYRYCILL